MPPRPRFDRRAPVRELPNINERIKYPELRVVDSDGKQLGVAVTIDSTHQCMTMRGIKKEQATTVTNYYLGQFKDDLSYQNRYLRFISITKD